MRAVLPPQVQHVLESVRRDERGARTAPLEQRVRRDRRPVRESLELVRADGLRGGEHRLLLPARRRHLRRPQLVAVEQDGVGERAADVDAEDRHGETATEHREAGGVRCRAVAHGVDGEILLSTPELLIATILSTVELWFECRCCCVLAGASLSFGTIGRSTGTSTTEAIRDARRWPDAATAILDGRASMVSLTALVLTITMVVVQLAMGQFSPRIVQRILRDKPSQLAIGLFVATFVHAILALREVTNNGDGTRPACPDRGR